MAISIVDAPLIVIGSPWQLSLEVAGGGVMFPPGSAWRTNLRATSDGPIVSAATITRVSDTAITIALSAAQTLALAALPLVDVDGSGIRRARVLGDIIRTDGGDRSIGLIIDADVVESPGV